MHPAPAVADDVVTSTARPADAEDRTMRLTSGSMLSLADDLRVDDRRAADARRGSRPATSKAGADRLLTLTGAHRASRGGSILLAGLRRIAASAPHA